MTPTRRRGPRVMKAIDALVEPVDAQGGGSAPPRVPCAPPTTVPPRGEAVRGALGVSAASRVGASSAVRSCQHP